MTNFTEKLKQFKQITKGAQIAKWNNKKIVYVEGSYLYAFNKYFVFRLYLGSSDKPKPGYHYLSQLSLSNRPLRDDGCNDEWDGTLVSYRESYLEVRQYSSLDEPKQVRDTCLAAETWAGIADAERVAGIDTDLPLAATRHKVSIFLESNSDRFAIAGLNSFSILFNPKHKIEDTTQDNWRWNDIYSFKPTGLNLGVKHLRNESLQINAAYNKNFNILEYLIIRSYSAQLVISVNTHKPYNCNLSEIVSCLPDSGDLQRAKKGWGGLVLDNDSTQYARVFTAAYAPIARVNPLAATDPSSVGIVRKPLVGQHCEETSQLRLVNYDSSRSPVKMLCYHEDGNTYYLNKDHEVIYHKPHGYHIQVEDKGYNQWVFIDPLLLEPFCKIKGAELALTAQKLRHAIVVNDSNTSAGYRIIGCVEGIDPGEYLSSIKTNINLYKQNK